MTATETIERVLGTGLLLREMIIVPTHGATLDEIREEEPLLIRHLLLDHVALLRRWNGIALDIIRLFGCGRFAGEIGRLSRLQISHDFGLPGAIVVGSDASGYAYVQSSNGHIFSYDTDGGQVKLLASGLDDFLSRTVFGRDAESFAGPGWRRDLERVGLI